MTVFSKRNIFHDLITIAGLTVMVVLSGTTHAQSTASTLLGGRRIAPRQVNEAPKPPVRLIKSHLYSAPWRSTQDALRLPELSDGQSPAPVKMEAVNQDSVKTESIRPDSVSSESTPDENEQDVATDTTSWKIPDIRSVRLSINLDGELPVDHSERVLYSSPQEWTNFQSSSKLFAWVAPDITYRPLYYENVALERYGQSHGPFRDTLSGAIHFGKSAILLPYHMRFDAPWSCDSPLGFCRPGNVTPYTIDRQWWGPLRKYR